MKTIIPLLALCLSSVVMAETSTWETLTRIDDKLKLERGEIALVVSISEPVYLTVKQPQRSSKGFRLRPSEDRQNYYTRSLPRNYVERRTQPVGWNKPFPISGPCTVRLGTSAVMTVRVMSTNQD